MNVNTSWNSQEWSVRFAKASREGQKALRVQVQESTRAYLTKMFATQSSGKPEDFNADYAQRIMDNVVRTDCDCPQSKILDCEPITCGKLTLIASDCLDAATDLISKGKNPLILNMASDFKPGGGYYNGAGAQEENLFRRTDLSMVLANELKLVKPPYTYPLGEFEAIYTPKAYILRSSESTGYDWIEPVAASFIAAPAYRNPKLVSGRLGQKHIDGMKSKLRLVFNTAIAYGHDSVVMSAWGCGAFNNPPQHIAELIREVAAEYDLNVVIAITKEGTNYGEFDSVLNPIAKDSGKPVQTLVGGQKVKKPKSKAK